MAKKTIAGGGSFTSKNISDLNSNFTELYAGTSGGTFTAPVIAGGLTASGSASNDFSGSTGTFKTSTGANTLGGATSVTGAITSNDATTPSVVTAAGATNTGNVTINGKTSGKLVVTTADATAQTVTLTTAAQTVGAGTVTIPNLANASVTMAMAAAAGAFKIAAGITALDGSNPTPIATGLTTIVGFSATLNRSTAITSGTAFVTYGTITAGSVDVYGWVVAGTASSGTENVSWVAIGT